MKQYRYLFVLFVAISFFTACSNNDTDIENDKDEIKIEGITASMTRKAVKESAQAFAISDFAVNTAEDPTFADIPVRTNWNLSLNVYKNNIIHNSALCPWVDGTTWTPSTPLYFPNYTRQNVTAKLYPQGWTNTVAKDQSASDGSALLSQDILIQNGEPMLLITALGHILPIDMKHGHCMIDFILDNVDETMINSTEGIKVHVGSDVYTPFRVDRSDKIEYMVILPLGITNPKVTLTTVAGAKYTETIEVTTIANYCYCVHMEGVELRLSTISIENWVYGGAVAGQYSILKSYPTFLGPSDTTCTLYFDNGLSQTLTFNVDGERTIKPVGRTIIKIEKSDGTIINNIHIVLNSMLIDLDSYFD